MEKEQRMVIESRTEKDEDGVLEKQVSIKLAGEMNRDDQTAKLVLSIRGLENDLQALFGPMEAGDAFTVTIRDADKQSTLDAVEEPKTMADLVENEAAKDTAELEAKGRKKRKKDEAVPPTLEA